MRAKLVALFAFVPAALAAVPYAGNAAPQILGLVATATPVPMRCAEGVCVAEVSGVCLQEHRPAPAAGTAYRAAEGTELVLVVRDRDGAARTVSVSKIAAIRSLRLFNAVSVSLPERVVRDLGGDGARASLSVGPLASAVPAAMPGDESPLSEKEIREYTGPLRATAENAIGRAAPNQTATRILNHMVNLVPADPSAGAERIASLRDRTIGDETAAASPTAARLVDRALDTCREMLRVERTPHLRACLANQHDILNADTTQAIWRSLRPGS